MTHLTSSKYFSSCRAGDLPRLKNPENVLYYEQTIFLFDYETSQGLKDVTYIVALPLL